MQKTKQKQRAQSDPEKQNDEIRQISQYVSVHAGV